MAFQAHVPEIFGVIQLAVAPVFLLTAIGTFISGISVRLGRAVDRRRVLENLLRSMPETEASFARAELASIARRLRYAYLAIVFAVTSALLVCLLIAGAFLGAFVRLDLSYMIGGLFIFAMLALISSLLLFLREVFLAVSAPRHVPR